MASITWQFNALERTFDISDVSISPAGDVEFLAGNAGVSVGPTLGHVITLEGRHGANVVEDAINNKLYIDTTGGGFTWTTVTGTTQAMAAHQGYVSNNAALVTFTLPATAAVGDTMMIAGLGAGKFKVAQNASQQIIGGIQATTVGVAGYVLSKQRYDVFRLICIVANTTWTGFFDQGGGDYD